jgi:DNA-binding NarL/FixJ family response regulator
MPNESDGVPRGPPAGGGDAGDVPQPGLPDAPPSEAPPSEAPPPEAPLPDAPSSRALPLDSLPALGAALAARPYARRGVPGSAATIRVLLVDDHAMLRAGLRAVLAETPDIVVVGEAASGADVPALVERLTPAVVVMDLDMPGGDGETATRAIAQLAPRLAAPPRVLVLTMHAEEERLLALLYAGASGYLAKDAAERELVDAVRVVAAGEVYVRPHVARLLARSVRARAEPDARPRQFEALSERERAVVRLTAEGYNGPEIGARLGISAKTVDTYKQRIEQKLGFRHRTDYVRLALALRLIEP